MFFRVLFILVVSALVIALIYFAFLEIMPDLIPLLKNADEAEIEAYLRESSTVKGLICMILLSLVQVWSMVIPGWPIQVAAGVVYGVGIGFVVCHLSSVLAHFVSILVCRRLGSRLEKWMPIHSEKNQKLNELLTSGAPAGYIVIIACMVPVLPNGIIAIVASKLKISAKRYAFCIWLGTIINVLFCVLAGKKLAAGDWHITLGLFLILAILATCMWIFKDNILGLYYQLFPGERPKLDHWEEP